MPNESAIQPQKKDRPKIQDILPRKNRRDSLLAKIIGPRAVLPRPVQDSILHGTSSERDADEGFLRSLSFGRKKSKNPEKVIRLKKIIPGERISAVSGSFRTEEKPIMRSGRVLEKPFLEPKVQEKIGEPAASSPHFHVSFRFLLLLGALGVAGIIVVLTVVFARATVSLEPSVATLSLDGIRVEAGTGVAEIDGAGKKIPASLIETAGSLKREFSSSAKESVSRKAGGTVRIYNAFSSAPQTLVARTRFQDNAGHTFFLKQRVTVPGAAIQNGEIVPRFISAAVEAEKAGEEFNIGHARFAIPGFAGTAKGKGFYAESLDSFTGGFVGEARVVSEQDIDAASKEVTAALFSQLKEELERKIPEGASAIQGAREITITALRKPKPGEMSDRFAIEADGKAALMLFRIDDLFSLLGILALSPDAEKKVSREKSHLEFDKVSLLLKNRVLSLDVRGTLAAVSVLTPDEIQRTLGGKTRADAENILRADSRIRAFGISLFPFWRNTIPSDAGKIRIFVQE